MLPADGVLWLRLQRDANVRRVSLFSYTARAKCSISQPDHTKTIEGVLFKALVKVGAVSQDNADNPTKVYCAANAGQYLFNVICNRSALREQHEPMQVSTPLVTSYPSK